MLFFFLFLGLAVAAKLPKSDKLTDSMVVKLSGEDLNSDEASIATELVKIKEPPKRNSEKKKRPSKKNDKKLGSLNSLQWLEFNNKKTSLRPRKHKKKSRRSVPTFGPKDFLKISNKPEKSEKKVIDRTPKAKKESTLTLSDPVLLNSRKRGSGDEDKLFKQFEKPVFLADPKESAEDAIARIKATKNGVRFQNSYNPVTSQAADKKIDPILAFIKNANEKVGESQKKLKASLGQIPQSVHKVLLPQIQHGIWLDDDGWEILTKISIIIKLLKTGDTWKRLGSAFYRAILKFDTILKFKYLYQKENFPAQLCIEGYKCNCKSPFQDRHSPHCIEPSYINKSVESLYGGIKFFSHLWAFCKILEFGARNSITTENELEQFDLLHHIEIEECKWSELQNCPKEKDKNLKMQQTVEDSATYPKNNDEIKDTQKDLVPEKDPTPPVIKQEESEATNGKSCNFMLNACTRFVDVIIAEKLKSPSNPILHNYAQFWYRFSLIQLKVLDRCEKFGQLHAQNYDENYEMSRVGFNYLSTFLLQLFKLKPGKSNPKTILVK
jgi:hypothetical protein